MMRPRLSRSMPRDGALGHPVGAGQVGVEDGGEVSSFIIAQQRVLGDAGVGDQHLDRALLGLDLPKAASTSAMLVTSQLDAEQPLGRLAGAVGDGDLVAGRGERAGDREADAAVAPVTRTERAMAPDAIVLSGG